MVVLVVEVVDAMVDAVGETADGLRMVVVDVDVVIGTVETVDVVVVEEVVVVGIEVVVVVGRSPELNMIAVLFTANSWESVTLTQ